MFAQGAFVHEIQNAKADQCSRKFRKRKRDHSPRWAPETSKHEYYPAFWDAMESYRMIWIEIKTD
jgi:hypothetical protein